MQQTIIGHFGFVFEEIPSGKSRDYRDVIVFRKVLFSSEMLSNHPNTKSRRFKFLWFEERFQKALFSSLISVDGELNNGEKKLRFHKLPFS